MQPERLGRFEIRSLLGEGGMGTVYAARDTDSGDDVALKVLSTGLELDPEKFQRFEQEVVALSRIEHPNIVRLMGPLERDGSKTFFAMELLEGTTLSSMLRRRGALPIPVALGIVRPLLGALEAAHRKGVVHRDIKPSNILMVDDTVKITDFGLARMEEVTRLTRTGQLMGTLDYMSPEQCEGVAVDHRTDLYSVGILLYEMLTGDPPFRRASPGAVLKGHLQEIPSRVDRIRADLPEGLAVVVERLLEKRPEDRYESAADALADLESIRDPSRTVTFVKGVRPRRDDKSTPTLPMTPRRRRRMTVVVATAVLLVAGIAIAAAVLLTGKGYPGRETPEDTLATLHRAARRGDFAEFSSCFLPECLAEHLTGEPRKIFDERRGSIVDFAHRQELPKRTMKTPADDLTFRIVSGSALPAILGIKTREPLRVAFKSFGDGFRIARVLPDRPMREAMLGGERRALELRITEVMKQPGRYLLPLLGKAFREGKMPPEKVAKFREKLTALTAGGRKLDYRILRNESTYERGRVQIVVECKGLADALMLRDKRFIVEFARGRGPGPDRRMQIRSIRPFTK